MFRKWKCLIWYYGDIIVNLILFWLINWEIWKLLVDKCLFFCKMFEIWLNMIIVLWEIWYLIMGWNYLLLVKKVDVFNESFIVIICFFNFMVWNDLVVFEVLWIVML